MIIDFATDDLRRAIKELSGSTGGDASELAPVSALPTSAEAGTVVALYKEEVPLPAYIRFEERDDLGDNNDKTGGRFYFPYRCGEGHTSGNPIYIGSVSTDDEHSYDITLYALDDPDFIYVQVSGFAGVVIGYGADGTSLSHDGLTFMSHEPENFGDDGMLDFYPTTTGSVSFDLNESEEQLGVYQYDGTNWNQLGTGGSGGSQNYIILDDLTGTGEEGQLYSYHNRLYRWVNGAGRWGKWIIGYDNNSDMYSWGAGNNTAYSHLVYSYLPFTADTWLCQIKILNNIRYIAYHYATNELYVYSSQDFSSTPVATISMNGQEVEVAASGRNMYISWVEGCITFRQVSSWSQMQSGSYADTAVSTAHFEAFDVDYFKGKTAFDKNSGIGVVLSNSEGVAQFTAGLGTTMIYANTTGYDKRIQVYNAQSNNFPSRIFVPTQGGTAGQMLISAGNNAEPTWTNWIKSVQITTAEYEALVTKDPNTLYLIVDE